VEAKGAQFLVDIRFNSLAETRLVEIRGAVGGQWIIALPQGISGSCGGLVRYLRF
jgi:hypothetical protein